MTATVLPGGPRVGDVWSAALGDVNGDGALDLVIANHGGGSGPELNQLLLGKPGGGFADAASDLPGGSTWTHAPGGLFPGKRTTSMALGDVNGDGNLDIVFGNPGYHTERQSIQLLLGRETGSLTCSPSC